MPLNNICILIIEDEPDLRELICLTIIKMGFKVLESGNIANGLNYIAQNNNINMVLTDMRLPDGMGSDIVKACSIKNIPCMVMTAYGSTEGAIQLLKMGAIDYLTKPVSIDVLRQRILEVLGRDNIENSNNNNELNSNKKYTKFNLDEWLIGKSSAMLQVKNIILQYAQSLAPVMIMGESGTGKEKVAKAIHMNSNRKGNFVAVNCGAIPENLMESEFFGAIKGAYTGASTSRDGLFLEANNGTLFLDEIAELPLQMQTKLLRVLQERKIRQLGATNEQKIDVRIICATHKDMQDMVKQQKFRHDLYYRIHVLPLNLPNLNARKEDIALIVEYILQNLNSTYKQNKKITKTALNQLIEHKYTGNVRELENLLEVAYAINNNDIEHIQIISNIVNNNSTTHNTFISTYEKNLESNQTIIDSDNLTNIHEENLSIQTSCTIQQLPIDLPLVLANIERKYIVSTLQQCKYNQSLTAKNLNLTLRQLRYKIEQLQINLPNE